MSWTLVTGGAKGLGAEICRTLASEGYSLIIHYNESQSTAEEVADECRSRGAEAEILQGDFSTNAEIEDFSRRYIQQYPDTKFLINNVGPYLVKSAMETTLEEWQRIFQTNLNPSFILTKALSQSLKKNKGALVNVGVAGLQAFRADSYSSAYSAAKTSLYSLTKSFAKELAPFKVCVNMVSPGYLENSTVLPDHFPMGRPCSLAEVARVVAFLLKQESITGQNIEIAGGIRL